MSSGSVSAACSAFLGAGMSGIPDNFSVTCAAPISWYARGRLISHRSRQYASKLLKPSPWYSLPSRILASSCAWRGLDGGGICLACETFSARGDLGTSLSPKLTVRRETVGT